MSARERAHATCLVRAYRAMWLAAGLSALLGGCAAGGRSAAPAAMAPAESPGAHAEIARLWDEIDTWRGQAGTAHGEAGYADAPAAEPAEAGAIAPSSMGETEAAAAGADSGRMSAVPQPPDAACPASASEPPECRDNCTLAGSICDNAGRICRIAQQLAGDDWAAGKCTDASAVCRQATADCCDCRAGS
jgi:hypothetical protein